MDAQARDLSLPPHDTLAEESVIGSIMLRSSVLDELASLLQPGDFYRPQFRHLYAAMLALHRRGEPVDYTTVADELQRQGAYEQAGGLAQLAEISLAVPTSAFAGHYARIVARHALYRRLISLAHTVAEKAYMATADPDLLLTEVDGMLLDVRAGGSTAQKRLFLAQEWANAVYEDLERRSSGEPIGVTTGFVDLDRMLVTLERQRLYLLMGSAGTGKSQLAHEIAAYVADHYGHVLYASIEMPETEVGRRHLSALHGVRRTSLTLGRLADDEAGRFASGYNAMQQGRLHISAPTGPFTTTDLRADVRRAQALLGEPLRLVVCDYVQKLSDIDGDGRSRERNVAAMARGLKSLAQELNVPVLAPVQPNRDGERRGIGRPKLSDLRESGVLEHESDVVLGLFREEMTDPSRDNRGVLEVWKLKDRPGVGTVVGSCVKLLWWGGRYNNFDTQNVA